MIIETERLQLRGFSVYDLDSIYELVYANAVVKDAWSGRQGTPEEIKRAFAEDWIATKSEYGLKALELKETASLVGLMGFQRHMPDEDNSWVVIESDPAHKVGGDPAFIESELTYALGRSYWGTGTQLRWAGSWSSSDSPRLVSAESSIAYVRITSIQLG